MADGPLATDSGCGSGSACRRRCRLTLRSRGVSMAARAAALPETPRTFAGAPTADSATCAHLHMAVVTVVVMTLMVVVVVVVVGRVGGRW